MTIASLGEYIYASKAPLFSKFAQVEKNRSISRNDYCALRSALCTSPHAFYQAESVTRDFSMGTAASVGPLKSFVDDSMVDKIDENISSAVHSFLVDEKARNVFNKYISSGVWKNVLNKEKNSLQKLSHTVYSDYIVPTSTPQLSSKENTLNLEENLNALDMEKPVSNILFFAAIFPLFVESTEFHQFLLGETVDSDDDKDDDEDDNDSTELEDNHHELEPEPELDRDPVMEPHERVLYDDSDEIVEFAQSFIPAWRKDIFADLSFNSEPPKPLPKFAAPVATLPSVEGTTPP